VGQAVTVKLPIGDSMVISKAFDVAQEGDVLVIDAHGTTDNAVMGDGKYLIGHLKGIAGVVCDGAVRDIKGMREYGFPVWARSLTCRSSSKNNPGELNVPISCGGVAVLPGDIIFADEEGVVVVPPLYVDDIIENLEKKIASAQKTVAEVRAGQYVTGKFLDLMEKYGYQNVR
jgi:4-hydroxy-4-methyl-2-oxoglutarate aldolase